MSEYELCLQPDATDGVDTSIANTGGNLGTSAELTIGNVFLFGGNTKFRALLRFDLTALPEEVGIEAATLTMHGGSAGFSGTKTFRCYRLTRHDWTETGATWTHYKAGSTWTTAGGDYATQWSDATTIGTADTLIFDGIAPLVQEAYEQGVGYVNLILVGDETAGVSSYYLCGSSDNGTPAYRPELCIEYNVNPIVEQIAVKLRARLAQITTGNGWDWTAVVERPTRLGGYVPQDKSVVLFQGQRTRPREPYDRDGSFLGLAWIQTFHVAVFALQSDENTDAIETLVNTRAADVEKAICTPLGTETTPTLDWARVDGLALQAEFGDPQEFPETGQYTGTVLAIDVLYRVRETNPYTNAV